MGELKILVNFLSKKMMMILYTKKTGWSDLSDLWNNNYLEYESDGTRNKVYHQKITPN